MTLEGKYLFIAGVPKSGTSFLFDLLSNHDFIIPSSVKETNFFLNKDHPLLNTSFNCHRNEINDFRLFFKHQEGIKMDGSCHMFNQESSIDSLGMIKNKKVIIVLRDPVNRLYSSFNFSKNNLSLFKNRDFRFQNYINLLLNDNMKGLQSEMRSGIKADVLFKELRMGEYARYLEKWKKSIPPGDLKVLQFEQLVEKTEEIVIDILNWLSLEYEDSILELTSVNKSLVINQSKLHFILRNFIPEKLRFNIFKNIYYKFQGVGSSSSCGVDEPTELKLRNYYREMNKKIIPLVDDGFDLELWK